MVMVPGNEEGLSVWLAIEEARERVKKLFVLLNDLPNFLLLS
jgi:hypothetical protein